MNLYEVEESIKGGENLYTEFKQSISSGFAEEIVAFLNTEGGTIFIGVTDDKNIIGIEGNNEEKIMNICRDAVIPAFTPIYEEICIRDKKIGVLTIEKGSNKPYYTKNDKYYIRVGSTKRIASKDELLRLFEAGGMFHYDVSGVAGTSLKDLNMEEIKEYFEQYNSFDIFEEDEETLKRILVNADILKEGETEPNCTVGGLLIFGKKPQDKLFQSGISFAHFKGIDIAEELIDKKEIVGRMKDVVEQALTVIKNNMLTKSTIEGAIRNDVNEYDHVVIREGLVNALVHRNYSISGSKIRIFMFDDRIEFHSPGRIPNTVTIEKMKIGVSYARNPFLVKYMENMRYIDKLGRGIPMILSKMKKSGRKEPGLEMIGEEFILTVFNK